MSSQKKEHRQSYLSKYVNIYIYIYIYTHTHTHVYIECNWMKTQTWLNCHYKFISAENITILFVSSDDFLHGFLKVAEHQMWSYCSYVRKKIKFTGEGRGGQSIRCQKHQETGVGFLCKSSHHNLRPSRGVS